MIRDKFSAVLALFQRRKTAYQMVFDKENKYLELVLKDLAKFCRAYDSCWHKDPRVHAAMEGRREVWLRIEQHLNLTTDELYAIHRAKDLLKEAEK